MLVETRFQVGRSVRRGVFVRGSESKRIFVALPPVGEAKVR